MKNLKKLKEKREELINGLTDMVTELESGEVRSLTVEERADFDAKKAEIESIDETIARVEEMRAKAESKEAVVELNEKRDKEVSEKRALESFFRGHDLMSEERAMLASNSNNQVLMPIEVSKTIMQKLEEQCPIMERAKRFSSKGTIKLIKEDAYGSAGITAENAGFKDSDVEFSHIELRAFKVTAQVQATFEMLQNSEIDLTQYLMDVIVRRLSRELNKLFLVGTGTNQPTGILKAGIEHTISADLSVKDFISMQTAMHPDYLNGCVWLVNRNTFTEMANLLDGNGRPYLISNYDAVSNKIVYNFLGLPVVVDYNMPEETPVAMANIGEAYAINVLTDITVRHLTEVGFASGYEVFAGYVLVDGKTVNEDAIVIGKKNALAKAKTK